MPFAKFACTAAVAVAAIGVVPSSHAIDVDPAADTASATVAPTHNLFTSWFATRAPKVDPVVNEGATTEGEAAWSPASQTGFRASDLVVNALGLLGIGYRLGGNTPQSGFDCSGMVRYVFQNALGLDLPRRAEEISRVGTKVDRAELKPGDLVFYKTLRKTFSHVGIYLGNNRFIHAPSAGGAVRVDDMSQSYWVARFNGARRVAT